MTRRSPLAAAALALASGLGPARAAPPAPVSNVVTVGYQYVPGDVREPRVPLEVVRGGTLAYTNLDPLEWHTVTSYDEDASKQPLFETALLGPGQSAAVRGVEKLRTGTYAFYCRIHTGMEGRLEVVPPTI